ncbi:hypothetical protein UFOVP1435_29 [uncultured Caudovirales phage]|uniref:Uncharacterized protein n=3 Tax=uncultured Caudovirales phage TaxID=2100421 RepID=A0A6J7XAX7_9CAUD|nr:hypothetical protein UFOVP1435_29 [uncultured Caudovirales phage]CAB5227947.1 hypothetical protein UFOVP1530_19 [uncultured Caudovirales phage]
MPYLLVDSFGGGLDSRRHPLTAKASTLRVLNNAHITRGGEIEKRKAFQVVSDPRISGSFGAVAGIGTIYIFKPNESQYPDVSFWVNEPSGGSGKSVKFTIQYLLHPFEPQHLLSGIRSATIYGGYPFVVAEFNNGDRFPFWNGKIISQSIGGIIPANAADLVGAFPYNNWNAWLASLLNNGKFLGIETLVAKDDNNIYVKEGTNLTKTDYFASYESFGFNNTSTVTVTGGVNKKFTVKYIGEDNSTALLKFDITNSQEASSPVPGQGAKGYMTFLNSRTYSFRISYSEINWGRNVSSPWGAGNFFTPGFVVKSIKAGEDELTSYDVTLQAGQSYADFWKAVSDSVNVDADTHGYTSTPGGIVNVDWHGMTITEGESSNDTGVQSYSMTIGYPGKADYTMTTSAADVGFASYWSRGRGNGYPFRIINATQGGGIEKMDVNGVNIIGHRINYKGDMTNFVQSVVDLINNNTATTGYAASRSSLALIVFNNTLSTNTNQLTVYPHGTMKVAESTITFSGGKSGISGKSQKTNIRLIPRTLAPGGGPFDYVGSDLMLAYMNKVKVAFTIEDESGNIKTLGADTLSGVKPDIAFTYKNKAYLTSESVFYFSALNDVTRWESTATGSGFIDTSNNSGVHQNITGLGIYAGKLSVFTRNNIQIWALDPDPTLNRLEQDLSGTGCLSANSVSSFGSVDTFYISDAGLRSLRSRDNYDSAFMNDAGHPIDSLLIQDVRALTEDNKKKICAIVEPDDNRFWVAIGGKIYVYSYFPGSQINAWSTYTPKPYMTFPEWLGSNFNIAPFAAGEGGVEPPVIPPEFHDYEQWLETVSINTIDAMVILDGRVYLRSGDHFFLYGGWDNATYDNSEVIAELPYLDGSKPATFKEAKGIDMTCQGNWTVEIGFDHTAPTARDTIAEVSQSTFALGRFPATGYGTHFGPKITNASDGYALLANFIVHYDEMHSKHEAG